MRKINKHYIHCSASDNPAHDDIEVIRRWHLERGWSDIGYHYFITKDGTVHEGRPLKKIPAAQKGHNTGSVTTCLSGLEQFTQKQFNALREHAMRLDDKFDLTHHGHCEVSNKLCPNFDYRGVLGLDLQGNMARACFIKKPWWRVT